MKNFAEIPHQKLLLSHDPFPSAMMQTIIWRMFWSMSMVEGGTPMEYRYQGGELRDQTLKIDDLVALIPGGRVVYSENNRDKEVLVLSDDSIFKVTRSHAIGSMTGGIWAYGSAQTVNLVTEAMRLLIAPPKEQKGLVKSLMRQSHGLEISTLGAAGKPLERGNYDAGVLDAFDHVVADLSSSDPCGKLIILDGPPGTGKTYLIRGIIDTVPAEFVFVPPNIVQSLAGPEIISVLVNDRMSDDDVRPYVLIVEDADEALQTRMMDNLGSISSMLNMTDGIVGAALDIRVIASTNMDIKKMSQDEALLRNGRLCRRINIGPLSEEKSIEVAERLGLDPFQDGAFPNTIAELYRMAHDKRTGQSEKKPEPKPKKSVGFGGNGHPGPSFVPIKTDSDKPA